MTAARRMLTGLSIRDVVLIESARPRLRAGPRRADRRDRRGQVDPARRARPGARHPRRQRPGPQRPGAGGGQRQPSSLPPDHPALALLDENGLDGEPGEPLVIRRIVKADGGSRAFVNDQPVSAGLLRELGALLVEIHGQHDDRGLLNPRGHRALLDAFGRIDTGAGRARCLGSGCSEAEAALAAARAALEDGRARPRLARPCRRASSTGSRPSRARRRRSPALRADMQAGARLGERARRDRPAARGLGGRPRPAAPGGAAARPDRRRA